MRRNKPLGAWALLHLAVFAVGVLVVMPFGCALSDTTGAGGHMGKACTNDGQCPNDGPCTVGKCDASNTCVVENLGHDPPDDKAGDCQKPRCDGAQFSHVPDDGDVPNDNNPCTVDGCNAGMPEHKAKMGDCHVNGHDGQCNVKTKTCEVPCQTMDDCAPNPPNPCVVGACDFSTNTCKYDDTSLDGEPVPDMMQTAGDCKLWVCSNGMPTEVVDDADKKPPDPCKTYSCSNGTQAQHVANAGDQCADANPNHHLCDGSGNCVECNTIADCGPPLGDCWLKTCIAGVCGDQAYGPGTTGTLTQTSGDCHQRQCDGAGNEISPTPVNDNDKPSDGNPCHLGACSNGVASENNVTDGTACGNGATCYQGNCGCTTVGECPSHPGHESCTGSPGNPGICVCTPDTCASLNKHCGTTAGDGCGGTGLNCNDGTIDGGETDTDCGGPSCTVKCGQGKHCNAGSDCTSGFCVDNVCCESMCTNGCNACSSALTGQTNGLCRGVTAGTDPKGNCSTNNPPCGLNGQCDGAGACQYYAIGSGCGSTCASGTQETDDTCNASHMCTANNTFSCNAGYACVGGACKTSCAGNGDCASGYYCNGSVCTAQGMNGDGCSAGGQCTSGNCVDGVCCGTASCPNCKTCNGSMPGTCTNIAEGGTDTACSGTQACDGSGNCKSADGQSCGGNMACASNNCNGGTCCDPTCTGACKSCDMTGTCSTTTNGTVANKCDAMNGCAHTPCICNGVGACVEDNGATCMMGSQCASNDCSIDGYCCSTSCNTVCSTCSSGACAFVTQNAQQPMLCDDMHGGCVSGDKCACDGAGACKAKNMESCTQNSDCASGNCNLSSNKCM
ncbi:MAG TPA: hypothetical protein VHB21_23930 [Minicystis sp.]|nr:hypothetical protein [Minicystis sp.]